MSITNAERLLVDRRRRAETQKDAARRLKVPFSVYKDLELGNVAIPKRIRIPKLGKVKPYERCLIRRKRTSTTQTDIARALKRSRRWVTMMERGMVPCQELVGYWDARS